MTSEGQTGRTWRGARWSRRVPAGLASPGVGRVGVLVVAALLPLCAVAVVIRSDRAQGNVGSAARVDGTLDSFVRPPGVAGLGAVPDGPAWTDVAGTWGISGAQAMVITPAAGASIAVVPLDRGNGAAEVKVAKLVGGAGLVFRYRDPSNYWSVTAVPYYGTWAVMRTVRGVPKLVTNTGLSTTADGTIIGVRLKGETIDVVVNRAVLKTIKAGELRDAPGVGVTAQGGSSESPRFDDFRLSVPD